VTVNGEITAVDVSKANVSISDLSLTLSPEAAAVNAASLHLTGSLKTDSVELVISNGSVKIAFIEPVTINYNNLPLPESIKTASFSLDASLAEIGTTDPVSFEGKLSLFARGYADMASMSRLQPISGLASGALKDNSNSFVATVSANLTNPDSFNPSLDESPDNMAKFLVSIALEAQYATRPLAQFSVSVERTGRDFDNDNDILSASATLSYGGKSTTVEANHSGTNDGLVVTIRNQDSAILTINNTDTAAETGELSVEGFKVATVQKLSKQLFKISYEDGSFESIN
jgi:hypothetical protein